MAQSSASSSSNVRGRPVLALTVSVFLSCFIFCFLLIGKKLIDNDVHLPRLYTDRLKILSPPICLWSVTCNYPLPHPRPRPPAMAIPRWDHGCPCYRSASAPSPSSPLNSCRSACCLPWRPNWPSARARQG